MASIEKEDNNVPNSGAQKTVVVQNEEEKKGCWGWICGRSFCLI